MQVVEPIQLLLIASALFFNFKLINITRAMVLNVPFIYFGVGTLILGLSHLFILFSNLTSLQISATSTELWLHLMIYIGLIAFMWGGVRFRNINHSLSKSRDLSFKDKMILSALILAVVLIFSLASFLESFLAVPINVLFLDFSSLFHFTVFILTLLIVLYMYYIKKDWDTFLSVGATPLFGFLSLISLQHLWEFLTESLNIIPLSEEISGGIEQGIEILAFILLNFTLIRMLGKIKEVFKIN